MGNRKGDGHMNQIPLCAVKWEPQQLILSMYLYQWDKQPFTVYRFSKEMGWSHHKFRRVWEEIKDRGVATIKNNRLIILDRETIPVKKEWVDALEAREITESVFAYRVKRDAKHTEKKEGEKEPPIGRIDAKWLHEFREAGLPLSSAAIYLMVAAMENQPPIGQKEMADNLQISREYLNRQLKQLERKGYIRKTKKHPYQAKWVTLQ
jgi:hypothetical protein